MRSLVATMFLLLSTGGLSAQHLEQQVINGDTLTYHYTPIDQSITPQGGSSGRSILEPIPLGNGGTIAFTVAPAYSNETSLLLAAQAQYLKYATTADRSKLCDISIYGSASIIGYYNITLAADHLVSQKLNQHISYGATILSEPTRVWGISFLEALMGNDHRYTEKEYSAWARYTITFKAITLGIYADYRYLDATNLDTGALEIFKNNILNTSTAGIGASIAYRRLHAEALANSYEGGNRGISTSVETIYRPELLSNINGDAWSLRAIVNYYQPLWRGSMLAFDIYGEHHSANTPWLLTAELGGNSRMRGYYAGRFRGNNLLSAQVELRQRLWRGIGIVAWGGAGTALSTDDNFSWSKVLPTYGLGLRYKYDRLTLRADIGFGRNSYNILFGLGEAF